MSNRISIRSIIDKTLDGISQAQKDYEIWTDGAWLWEAPESMLSTYIAKKIASIDGPKGITLENSAIGALEDAGAVGRGKLHKNLRHKGRFDILVWWASDKPRAVIEVKNQITVVDQIRKDLERIEQVLKRKNSESSFQFGLIAYYTSCTNTREFTAKERLESRLINIHKDAKELLGNEFKVTAFNKKIMDHGEDGAWVSAVLLIQLANQ